MNILDKPTRPIFGGLYNLTLDGYVICAQRRGSQLKDLALRPSLEYGKLIYRMKVNGQAKTIRAFIAVREAWGQHMQDPGDYKEMCKVIDAHNAAIRANNREKTKSESCKKAYRGICPYCKKRPIKTNGLSKTCGTPSCMAEHRRVIDKGRYRSQNAANTERPSTELATLGQYAMPCPWAGHYGDKGVWWPPVTSQIPGVYWVDAQMDPFGGVIAGVKLIFEDESIARAA